MRLFLFGIFVMSLFAANSLLCRLALIQADMAPQTFTCIRLVSGALMLLIIGRVRQTKSFLGGSYRGAAALFVYMAAFSFAYIALPAATGALIMVGAILFTAIIVSRLYGERLGKRQITGLVITMAGLLVLLGPAVTRPPLFESLLMAAAGAAWSAYSIIGKKSSDPVHDTMGNFVRALPLSLLLLPFITGASMAGTGYAVASGALASGLGYVLWYRLVPKLSTVSAAMTQLSLPVLTALGAWLFLRESLSLHLLVSSSIILSGIAYAQTGFSSSKKRNGQPPA